eukprot:g4170.t1
MRNSILYEVFSRPQEMSLWKRYFRVRHQELWVVTFILLFCCIIGYSWSTVAPKSYKLRPITTSNIRALEASKTETNTSQPKGITSEMVFKESKLRGFHNKSMLSFERISPDAFSARNHLYERWMERCKQGRCSDHLDLAFPKCKAFINHHYKFIWMRWTKVGGTALREPLGWICGDKFLLNGLKVNDEYCSVHLFTNATETQVIKWWKEYFVFSIIRNPYTRFASGEQYIAPKVKDLCNKTFSFSEVCRSPYEHTHYCLNNECCSRDVEHHFLHMAPQSQCLFDTNLNPVVDYFGDTETLEEDTHTIVSEINRRRDPSLPPLKATIEKRNTHPRQPTSGNSYTVDLYKNNEQCLESVGEFFGRDFKLLGYDKLDTMPQVFDNSTLLNKNQKSRE